MLRQKAHDAIYCSEVRNKTPLYANYQLTYPVFPGWPPIGTGVASVQILVRARDSSRTSHEGQKRPVFASVSTRIRKLRATTFGVRIGFHKDMQVQILCSACFGATSAVRPPKRSIFSPLMSGEKFHAEIPETFHAEIPETFHS